MILIVIAIIIAVGIFGFANFYIGLRLWQYIFSYIPFLKKEVYWTVFWLIALSFILGRFRTDFIPSFISNPLSVIGSYWLAVMLYTIMLLFLIDLGRFMAKHTRFNNLPMLESRFFNLYVGISLLIIVSGIILYGMYQARHITVNHYDISIEKSAGTLQNLHVAMISDIHLGAIVDNSRLLHIVEKINSLKPDIVLLGGDIIDDDIDPYIKQGMSKTFKKLDAKYGVYSIFGNHEGYGRRSLDIVASNYEAGGMKVLRDQYIKVAGSLYIIGRNDSSHSNSDTSRKHLNDILAGVDKSMPLILLDHSPSMFKDAVDNNIDLQLSGHTHAGQTFPSTFINKFIFEDNWGYLKKGNSQLIVSSGVGTWGPPIRVGSDSEIVDINIKFGK